MLDLGLERIRRRIGRRGRGLNRSTLFMEEFTGMRKEVIRSLVVWPAAASATIVALVWLAQPNGPTTPLLAAYNDLLNGGSVRHWPVAPQFAASTEMSSNAPRSFQSERDGPVLEAPKVSDVALRPEAPLPDVEAGLSERPDQGVRAMKIPSRLEDVFASVGHKSEVPSSDQLIAPIRNEQHETAGLVLSPQSERSAVRTPTLEAGDRRVDKENLFPGAGDDAFSRLEKAELGRKSMIPRSVENLGRVVPLTPQQLADKPSVGTAGDTTPSPVRRDVQDSPAGWPVTKHLDEQLQSLIGWETDSDDQNVRSPSDESDWAMWSRQVESRLADLRSLPRIGAPVAGELIEDLMRLAEEGIRGAEELDDRPLQIRWLNVAHSVARRTAVWMPIWKLAQEDSASLSVSIPIDRTGESIDQAIERVRADLAETHDQSGWVAFLLLEEVGRLSHSDQFEQRQVIAQRFLSRLRWHGLHREHQRWLQRASVTSLAERIQPWAQGAVDYAKLLNQIERQESDAIDLAAIDISGAIQSLRFADNEDANRVADVLDTYYRNANVRMAISETLLQRMLPEIEKRSVPVRTKMFGSQVHGVSEVESDLAVDLKPAADRWLLDLRTQGDVRSRSTGVNGSVSVRTMGDSRFDAVTSVEVTAEGVHVGNSDVDVHGNTTLRGIRTDYDGWPLIGSLAQSYAASEYRSIAPRSNRIANQRIGAQVQSEIDTKVEQKVDQSTQRLQDLVLGPLGRLRLDPKVIDMQTTDTRLLARYRLAGDWQLGAFTPRPRAPSSSLMSLQIHQSALNNTLEQLVPREQSRLIADIIGEGMTTFGYPDGDLPADIPDDVEIQFARTRPITVEIMDGEFWVTLRVMRVTRGDRLDLKRFIVRALYRPQLDGLNATLVREGHLRISGPGMSMRQRLPIRAIFNKVLSPARPWQLTLPQLAEHRVAEGLAISQFELRQGWIAIAVSQADAPRIALQRKQYD